MAEIYPYPCLTHTYPKTPCGGLSKSTIQHPRRSLAQNGFGPRLLGNRRLDPCPLQSDAAKSVHRTHRTTRATKVVRRTPRTNRRTPHCAPPAGQQARNGPANTPTGGNLLLPLPAPARSLTFFFRSFIFLIWRCCLEGRPVRMGAQFVAVPKH